MRSKETDFIINMLRRQERESKINRIKITVSIIILILAMSTHYLVRSHPNPLYRIFWFIVIFGGFAYSSCSHYVKWAIRRSGEKTQ